jgi:hypothetical protein
MALAKSALKVPFVRQTLGTDPLMNVELTSRGSQFLLPKDTKSLPRKAARATTPRA